MGSPLDPRRIACLLITVAAVGIAGCGGGDGGASSSGGEAPSSGKTVTIEDFAYAPAGLTVTKGTTVEFANEDGTSHTATSKEAGAFDTGTIEPGQSGKVTLDRAGTFSYYCVFHPFLKGTITVDSP
jgi:plastocyanin